MIHTQNPEEAKPTYRSISIPTELIDQVETKLLGKYGYRSVQQFVTDAVRRRIEALEKETE